MTGTPSSSPLPSRRLGKRTDHKHKSQHDVGRTRRVGVETSWTEGVGTTRIQQSRLRQSTLDDAPLPTLTLYCINQPYMHGMNHSQALMR